MESYSEYLKSPKWAGIRARIWKRDSYKCQCCFAKADCVHHRKYSKQTLAGQASCLHFLISLCNSCHQHIEFNDKGEKISQPAHKEQRLNSLMLTLASRSLKDWSRSVMVVGNRPVRMRPEKKKKTADRTFNGAPIRQVSVHDLARSLESLAYDVQRTKRELAALTAQVSSVQQAIASLSEELPQMAHLFAVARN